MIPLDWKERLQRDTEDFLLRKLPAGKFDIDIIYNAYPERIDGKIPKEVITYVSKAIAAHVAKDPASYLGFIDFLWNKKGEHGKMATGYILQRIMRRNPSAYIDKVREYLHSARTAQEANFLLDKTVLPLLKNEPENYLDTVVKWMKVDGGEAKKAVIKQLVKLCKQDPFMLPHVFKRLEMQWLYADAEMIKVNIDFLKAISKIDPDFYASVYAKYVNTRNPEFVEIMAGAVMLYNPEMEQAFENWVLSGNARLKKAAILGRKLLLRKKKS
ncbi:MAG: hypothetical protein K8R90_11510 [Candidatus Cloacimonetes bacterium]|nr:hypothetical protein [Candidatus Cloacimonadota bacterium]